MADAAGAAPAGARGGFGGRGRGGRGRGRGRRGAKRDEEKEWWVDRQHRASERSERVDAHEHHQEDYSKYMKKLSSILEEANTFIQANEEGGGTEDHAIRTLRVRCILAIS